MSADTDNAVTNARHRAARVGDPMAATGAPVLYPAGSPTPNAGPASPRPTAHQRGEEREGRVVGADRPPPAARRASRAPAATRRSECQARLTTATTARRAEAARVRRGGSCRSDRAAKDPATVMRASNTGSFALETARHAGQRRKPLEGVSLSC